MKVAFINLSLRQDSKYRFLPVGLAYVMTAAKRAGFDFELIDMDIDKLSLQDLETIFRKKSFDVYAFGCIVTGFKLVKEISCLIKKINPESIIIAGNSVASSIPEILLEYTNVDIVVIGEGDLTIVELLNKIEAKQDLSAINGIVFKNKAIIQHTSPRPVIENINNLSFPDWDIFEVDKYKQYGTIIITDSGFNEVIPFPLNSARGCPYNCTFCYHVFKGARYRRYCEEIVMEEIKRLHYSYGCNYIIFWDELTFPNINSIENMIKRLSKLEFKIGWEAITRADLFKKEHLGLIKELREVGCQKIYFSLENANPGILAAMNKRIDTSQFIEQAKILSEGGITPLTSVIFGYPQETPETIRQTIKVCEECNIYPSVGYLLPLPGTPIYEWTKQEGYIEDEIAYLERIGDRQDFHINLTKMSDDEFKDIVESELRLLARKQGLELESVLKTTTYQKPKK